MNHAALVLVLATSAALTTLLGCGAGAPYHRDNVRDDSGDRVTLGNAQAQLRQGMSGSEVLEAMGSPNIVSTDESGREVWVYDKFATDATYSESRGWWFVGGQAGSTSRTQRTLTVIVKFDEDARVRDVAYHQSSF